MSALVWKRVGKGSGPGNVLNDRYEVRREGRRWIVLDRANGGRIGPLGFPTMAIARRRAEEAARAEEGT